MANTYFDPSTLQIADGDLAEATDINDFSAAVETSFDSLESDITGAVTFSDIYYLGPKSSAPTLDNNGNALIAGATYFDTSTDIMRVYNGTVWANFGESLFTRSTYTATSGQTTFTAAYDVGYALVYQNSLLLSEDLYTATTGTTVVLDTGATTGDIVEIIGLRGFDVADTYTKTEQGNVYYLNSGDLTSLVSTIGTTETEVVITGATTISANTTIPSTLSLRFIKGGSIDGAFTLTINGNIEAGLYQIFGSSITVTGSPKVDAIKPEWWKNNTTPGTTDMATALQAAIDVFADFRGGKLIISPNTAIGSTITITSKKGLIIEGTNGQGFTYPVANNAAYIPSLKWIGASGGTMIQVTNPLKLTMRNLNISGENIADYGLKISSTTTGWGVSNYEHLAIHSCNKNAMLKTATGAAGDFGRNHFKRCTFKSIHVNTASPVDDACIAYNKDSSVQDVYDHCEFIYKSDAGLKLVDTYAIWIEAGTPRIHMHDSYTVAKNGIYTKSGGGATPKWRIADHYSEDDNFINLVNTNTRQLLRNVSHVVSGGSSIIWGGASGGGSPLVIDGGDYGGSITLSNLNAGVMISNSPDFGVQPTYTDSYRKLILGRSYGAAGGETHSAVNGAAFVPEEVANQTLTSISANLAKGTIYPATLTGNTNIAAPANIEANGLDVGREIEYRITGHATNLYAVTLNAVFKLAGGAYTHSGIAKTDILRFRYDGTDWWEIGRVMDIQ